MSVLVNKYLVEKALNIAALSIEVLLCGSTRPDPKFAHVVVLNPLTGGDQEILGERTFGPAPANRSDWKREYDKIALSKAAICRRTGHSSGFVATCMPALLMEGDVHFTGGDAPWGVPVGTSGVESFLDEGVSRIIASIIDALVKQKLKEADEGEVIFLS